MSRVDFGWTFKPTQGNPAVRRRDVLRTLESLACKRIMQRPLAFVSEQVVLAAGLRVCLVKHMGLRDHTLEIEATCTPRSMPATNVMNLLHDCLVAIIACLYTHH